MDEHLRVCSACFPASQNYITTTGDVAPSRFAPQFYFICTTGWEDKETRLRAWTDPGVDIWADAFIYPPGVYIKFLAHGALSGEY